MVLNWWGVQNRGLPRRKSSGYLYLEEKGKKWHYALSYPPRVRVRATIKLSAAFFNDELSITIGGYKSAIAPKN